MYAGRMAGRRESRRVEDVVQDVTEKRVVYVKEGGEAFVDGICG
jgi:hypothetical protein